MSRVLSWRRFMAVRLEDDGGQPLGAFDLRATGETKRRMARHRLLARPEPSGLALFYRLYPDRTPPVPGPIASRERFTLTLHLREKDFFNRHHPNLTIAEGANLHLDNLDGGGAILADGSVLSVGAAVAALDSVQIGRRRLPVTVGLGPPPPTHVQAVDPLTGSPLIDPRPTPPEPVQVPVQASAGAAAFSAVLDIPPDMEPLIRVEEVPAGSLNRRAYADDQVAGSGAVGVIDLYWETAQETVPAPAGQVYRVVFARR